MNSTTLPQPNPLLYSPSMKSEEHVELGLPIIDANVSYQDFQDQFLRPLKPCIFLGLTEGWPAARDWTTVDSTSGELIPNFQALKDAFGKYDGCVTFCDETDVNGDAVQQEMPITQFIDGILPAVDNSTRKTYLKDFHFMRFKTSATQPYTVPQYFQGRTFLGFWLMVDDWFNRFAIKTDKDDFRFLYLGEDSSFTPLHHDVCMSHSWSTSLCGVSTERSMAY
jgi:hypothetical protein